MTDARKEAVAKLLQWGAGGAGAGAGAGVAVLAALNPDMLARIATSWPGVTFGMFCVAVGVLHRDFSRGVAALDRMAGANVGLTAAVGQLAARDQTRAEATEAAIAYVAQNTDRLMRRMAKVLTKLEVPDDE